MALTARSMQYSWGANVGIPLINEVAENISGHRGVIINRTRAQSLGIAEGDAVTIESVTGATHGRAVLREGIRPDTILMICQFDHWATPYAKDLDLPSLNSVTALSLSLTVSTGSGADLARVEAVHAHHAEEEAQQDRGHEALLRLPARRGRHSRSHRRIHLSYPLCTPRRCPG